MLEPKARLCRTSTLSRTRGGGLNAQIWNCCSKGSSLCENALGGTIRSIQSSRRLERECQRDLELMWLSERLAPNFKTIADFRKDNGKALRNAASRRSSGAVSPSKSWLIQLLTWKRHWPGS
jgi:hypothetical protein